MTLYSRTSFKAEREALAFATLVRLIGQEVLTCDDRPYHMSADRKFEVVRKWTNRILPKGC